MAWHVAVLGRIETIPSLTDLLDPPTPDTRTQSEFEWELAQQDDRPEVTHGA